MDYKVSLGSPLKHIINISITHKTHEEFVDFHLPMWRPGRYEAANYAKNIQKIEFKNSRSEVLNYSKPNHSTWRVFNKGQDISVDYGYYAHQLDAGNTWFSENHLYINFINCMLYNSECMHKGHTVKLEIPQDWKIACALSNTNRELKADNYYHMADSPVIASPNLDVIEYKSKNIPFKIWLQGVNNLDHDNIRADFKKFSDYQIELFGQFPEDQYHFLNEITPYKFYHGVEHAASTVICIGPGDKLANDPLYDELLGVSSHELFHAWNIIKIRPQELQPYRFNEPISFDTGFVAEGFTTYYGDLMLVRSGVKNVEWYMKELEKLLTRHFQNYGRLQNSVLDSSIDLWIDGYQAGTPHKKSSIYVEGAMVAICLDLMIRLKFNHQKSLDDVMRELWKRYGKTSEGYSYQNIVMVCQNVFEDTLEEFFHDHVQGTKDKWNLIKNQLEQCGIYMMEETTAKVFEGMTGAKVINTNGKLAVSAIEPDSLAERHFSIKDEIVTLNGVDATEDSLNSIETGPMDISIVRDGVTYQIQLNTLSNDYWKVVRLMTSPEPNESQAENLKMWLET